LAETSSHVLIAGVSTRAAAESAARAGFRVTTIDAFADLDQHPSVTAHAIPRGFSAHAAARAAREVACDAVVYLSNFENHPNAVRMLTKGRALWGNAPDVLRRVRDPILVARALARRGFAVPAVVPGEPGALEPWNPRTLEPLNSEWLVKPLASGGGHRVRRWRTRARARLPRGCYLQELISGASGSVVFAAAGGRAVPLGVSWQLIGEPAFGATGYRYCGSILAAPGAGPMETEAIMANAIALCGAVAEEFGLAGVNGIDFIARDGVAHAIEVNPRWSASMELVERAYGVSVFGAHAAACTNGVLPEFDLSSARRGTQAVGKAVLFARRDVVGGDTQAWLSAQADPPAIRDIPRPGERILAGRPVCTVIANGTDHAACHAALVRLAEQVFDQLSMWEREIA
jgi:uncharacterized protein